MTEPLENTNRFLSNTDRLDEAGAYREYFDSEEEFQEMVACWPFCPECGHLRSTRCSICKTAGELFPPADAEYWDDSPQSDDSACSCGHSCGEHCDDASSIETNRLTSYDRHDFPSLMAGELQPGVRDYRVSTPIFGEPFSTSVQTDDQTPSPIEKLIPEETDTTVVVSLDSFEKEINKMVSPPQLVTCFVCSEPFVPKFSPKCSWCGHRFVGEGEEYSSLEENDPAPLNHSSEHGTLNREAINPGVLLAFAGLVIGTVIAFIYLWTLF